jgi:chromosome segregation ATPase
MNSPFQTLPEQPPLNPWASNPAIDVSVRLATLKEAQREYKQLGQSMTAKHKSPHTITTLDENGRLRIPPNEAALASIADRLALLELNAAQTADTVQQLQNQTADLVEALQKTLDREAKQATVITNLTAVTDAHSTQIKAHAITLNFLQARGIFLQGWTKSRLTMESRTR